MSIAQLAPATTRGSSRWLLLGSLALNLFFIGVVAALAIRSPAPAWDRDVFVRVERIASTLPPADAEILRSRIKASRADIEAAQTKHRAAQDIIRAALRAQPFDAEALRTAMVNSRVARQAFDQTIQAMFADSAAQMSQAGREALADWPRGRKTAGDKP
jgi:uncharacterized membrane protein